MASGNKNRVCPVERAGSLDNRLRRWVQNPRKILGPYVREGMTVLDVGCGPGFFSLDMAYMVGASGRVIACDLQNGMLDKVKNKVQGTELEERITLHTCGAEAVGVAEPVDFVLAFYVLHELPDQNAFFREMASLLKADGRFLIVEPPFHVSKKEFAETMEKAEANGFTLVERPKLFFSRTLLLSRSGQDAAPCCAPAQ